MPLLFGIGATAALLVAFLIGFELGTGEDRVRTIIVGPSPQAGDASGLPSGTRGAQPVGLVQEPQVADELQQAYYANLRLGAWVVCADGPRLSCAPARYVTLGLDQPFAEPATRWPKVQVATVPEGSRIYLIGNLERVWLGAVERTDQTRPPYVEILGVTLNGSVQFLDMGDLPAGDYVVLDLSDHASWPREQVPRAIGLTITPGP